MGETSSQELGEMQFDSWPLARARIKTNSYEIVLHAQLERSSMLERLGFADGAMQGGLGVVVVARINSD